MIHLSTCLDFFDYSFHDYRDYNLCYILIHIYISTRISSTERSNEYPLAEYSEKNPYRMKKTVGSN